MIGQQPKATHNLHGSVKLQVSCSCKCIIIMPWDETLFNLIPFGQLKGSSVALFSVGVRLRGDVLHRSGRKVKRQLVKKL